MIPVDQLEERCGAIWHQGKTRYHQSELPSRHSQSVPSNPRTVGGPGDVLLASLIHVGLSSSLSSKAVGNKTSLDAFFAVISSTDEPFRALNFMRLQSVVEQYIVSSSFCPARCNSGFASLGCIPEPSRGDNSSPWSPEIVKIDAIVREAIPTLPRHIVEGGLFLTNLLSMGLSMGVFCIA